MADELKPSQRFDWHRKLLDSKLPPGAKLVGVAMWDHVNSNQGGKAYPGVDRLADRLGMSARTVKRHLTLLRNTGWLVRTWCHDGKRGGNDEYVLAVPIHVTAVTPAQEPNQTKPSVSGRQAQVTIPAKPGDTALAPQQEDQQEIQQERSADASRLHDFEEFFQSFPKQEDKAKAKSAYDQARKRTSAENLLVCANRYRIRCAEESTEPKYQCKPANWLRDQKWRDYELVDNFTEWGDNQPVPRWHKQKYAAASSGRKEWD